jgi:hypothetical protein
VDRRHAKTLLSAEAEPWRDRVELLLPVMRADETDTGLMRALAVLQVSRPVC